MLSNVVARFVLSCFLFSSPGICVVMQSRGPIEHKRLSSRTDRLPERATCPLCSFKRSPITVKLSPSSFKWAAASIASMLDVVPLPLASSISNCPAFCRADALAWLPATGVALIRLLLRFCLLCAHVEGVDSSGNWRRSAANFLVRLVVARFIKHESGVAVATEALPLLVFDEVSVGAKSAGALFSRVRAFAASTFALRRQAFFSLLLTLAHSSLSLRAAFAKSRQKMISCLYKLWYYASPRSGKSRLRTSRAQRL